MELAQKMQSLVDKWIELDQKSTDAMVKMAGVISEQSRLISDLQLRMRILEVALGADGQPSGSAGTAGTTWR